MAIDIDKLPMTLMIKLGSLIVHHEEAASHKGHHFDLDVIGTLRNDPDVVELMDRLDSMGMLPVKR